jgi:methionyl-tRNA formyltransferase
MNILFFGNSVRGLSTLRELIRLKTNIVGVIIENKSCYDEIKELAETNDIKFYYNLKVNDENFIKDIKKIDIDWFFVAGFSQIFKKDLLNVPKKGSINLHAGPLPRYRGSSPLNWAIINGEIETGVSIIKMDEGIDTGQIIAQKNFPIDIKDTIQDVHKKAIKAFVALIPKVLKKIQTQTSFETQDDSKAAYFGLRKPEDGIVDFKTLKALQVYNKIRALTHPYPGAFSYLNKKKIFMWSSELLNEDITGTPGEVHSTNNKGAIVICKDKALLIKTVQEENNEEKNAVEVLKQGDILESN